MLKRSLTIAGHRTSLALEPEFWQALDAMAAAERLPLIELLRRIDQLRPGANLSSAVRVAVLDWYRRRAAT